VKKLFALVLVFGLSAAGCGDTQAPPPKKESGAAAPKPPQAPPPPNDGGTAENVSKDKSDAKDKPAGKDKGDK